MTKISVLIPSRGNPKELAKAIRALIDNSSDANRVEIIVRLDADDPALPDYLVLLNSGVSAWTKFIIGQSFGYSGFNEYYEDCRRLACGDLMWVFNDDVLVETKDWDIIYETALSEIPFGVAAANVTGDGYQWCLPVVRREVFDAIGHFCPFLDVTPDRVLDFYARQSGRGTVAAVQLHHKLKPLASGSGREKIYSYVRSHRDEMTERWNAAAKQILEKTNQGLPLSARKPEVSRRERMATEPMQNVPPPQTQSRKFWKKLRQSASKRLASIGRIFQN